MTMTRRVRDLFAKRFEENGVDYTGLKIGSFINVELECPIPLTWLFVSIPGGVGESFKIEDIIFSVIDELGLNDEKFSAEFDWIKVTENARVYSSSDLEEF